MMSCDTLRNGGSIAVIGAGPAGLTLARLFQTRGFSVRIYERDASPTARTQGGSLDLRPDSGQRAIDQAGLSDAFANASRSEAKEFKLVDEHGRPHSGSGEETHEDAGPEIDRGDLRQLLLDSLAPGTVVWDRALKAVHPEPGDRWRLEFTTQDDVIADLVIGAEGVGSKVRSQLTPVKPRYTGMQMLAANIRRDLWRGSKLADLLGEGSVMFAGGDKTIFVQRCANDLILLYYSMKVADDWPKSSGFDIEDTGAVLAAVRDTYSDWSPEVLDMLTQIEGKVQRWPLSVMPPDYRWETRPGVTMLGDASHVMPPFTGKGVNLALFDALQLVEALTADPSASVTAAVHGFEAQMQARTRKEIAECLEVGRNFYGTKIDFDQPASAA